MYIACSIQIRLAIFIFLAANFVLWRFISSISNSKYSFHLHYWQTYYLELHFNRGLLTPRVDFDSTIIFAIASKISDWLGCISLALFFVHLPISNVFLLTLRHLVCGSCFVRLHRWKLLNEVWKETRYRQNAYNSGYIFISCFCFLLLVFCKWL